MNLFRYFGAVAAAIGFAGGVFVFVRVQILQSYPFHDGVFGNEPLFLGLTYTAALEMFGVVAAVGVLVWTYSREAGNTRTRLLKAWGAVFMVFGVLFAVVVYVETQIMWGEILPGVRVWSGLPGGGGYPWGTERVAYNTCLISSQVRGDCTFLNYNELLLIALLGGMVGFMLMYWVSDESDSDTSKG
ncbi:MAG TPA: hypothetical protein VEI80_00100 [Candidatus Acidoferrales bacterium]|nr:hypothetical protein [Candidatus Acidoferrales bacterium]